MQRELYSGVFWPVVSGQVSLSVKRGGCVTIVILCYYVKCVVPRKIRELVKDLQDAGFELLAGVGKGSHRQLTHANYPGAVTLSGRDGDDAKKYQEQQVKRAIEEVEG